MKLVFLNGRQGSGKTTQGDFLERMGFFRVIASKVLAEKNDNDPEYAEQVASCQSSGVLVPDELTIRVILDYLQESTSPVQNLVLDGCMRTPAQAKMMIEYHRRAGYDIKVCFLHVDEEIAHNRTGSRNRADDEPEILKRRLNAYYDNLAPVLATIVRLGCSIHTVNGNLPAEKVHHEICKVIGVTIKTPVLT